MVAYSINEQKKEVNDIDIHMQANTVYSFFNSILIDELHSLQGHIVYTDANALSNGKKPYFMGQQLLVGDALIIGKDGMQEIDVHIKKDDLESLINYDVSPFYTDTFELLKQTDINLYKLFKIDDIELNIEWVLYVFNIADDATKNYFLSEFKKIIDSNEDVEQYLQKMGKLAYNASKA